MFAVLPVVSQASPTVTQLDSRSLPCVGHTGFTAAVELGHEWINCITWCHTLCMMKTAAGSWGSAARVWWPACCLTAGTPG